ncbi:MAG: sigma-70 family RNA polymerase sigma factor [Armatimonadetes bacterium]|nr:sigma-70 family RNA polymerase sigma factor [Armatimonadota bacterium]
MEWVLGKPTGRQAPMNDLATESALIDRCRKQDPKAFADFIDLYQARVLGFVKRMVENSEDAADVTQEVFIRAYQNFHRFDQRSSVRTWLFRIAHNLCIDRARKTDRRLKTASLSYSDEDGDEVIDVQDTRWEPETMALDNELATVIERGIGELSEKLRPVLLLHDREDMAYEEIAELLQIPVGTVKSRLFLARAHLQQVLTNYWNGDVVPSRKGVTS